MKAIKAANLALSFILELCVLSIFGYWGFTSGQQPLEKIALGIAGPLVFVVVWGIFMAPRSSRRLQEPWRFITELIIFGVAVAALYDTGHQNWAGIFAAIYAIHKILVFVWKQ